MNPSARVQSVPALEEFGAALTVYAAEAARALESARGEIQRMEQWLEAQLQHWRAEVRRREEEVYSAQQELDRQRIVKQAGNHVPECPEQQMVLRKAKARLQMAQDKVETTRNWIRQYSQELIDHEGPLRNLQALLDADLPRASAFLEQKIESIEAYLARISTSPATGRPARQGSNVARETST